MDSKPLLHPAPDYFPLEAKWDTDDDAPGPRCGHTLTAVAQTKSHGPRLILFGGATAIEGGASAGIHAISVMNHITQLRTPHKSEHSNVLPDMNVNPLSSLDFHQTRFSQMLHNHGSATLTTLYTCCVEQEVDAAHCVWQAAQSHVATPNETMGPNVNSHCVWQP
ncbi:serine/threonine protein phosphatase, BSU1, Metallo-dependent phosphatase-like protein [Artemisia annua]|uniref:Serine/threonine protein phosphatase, BSU1, Metallo-dependent phosphatase-like protein n=1 Tax=Artemisia annua TaxID=35608 RepID=A0A2U1M8W6_ARTAN|nr:serine/threonine protein phosphatase, BSU1, Metallo-dependent phosphatase-like protein [Artemisia annua]